MLVKVAQQEEKTRGGILLPVSAQKRPTSGDVVSLGDGRLADGSVRPFYLKEGQTVRMVLLRDSGEGGFVGELRQVFCAAMWSKDTCLISPSLQIGHSLTRPQKQPLTTTTTTHTRFPSQVLYSKFGFMYQDVKLGDDEYILIREDDVIGIMPRANALADDIPELQPMGDRVLVRVEDAADVTIGGVVLPDSAKERPLR